MRNKERADSHNESKQQIVSHDIKLDLMSVVSGSVYKSKGIDCLSVARHHNTYWVNVLTNQRVALTLSQGSEQIEYLEIRASGKLSLRGSIEVKTIVVVDKAADRSATTMRFSSPVIAENLSVSVNCFQVCSSLTVTQKFFVEADRCDIGLLFRPGKVVARGQSEFRLVKLSIDHGSMTLKSKVKETKRVVLVSDEFFVSSGSSVELEDCLVLSDRIKNRGDFCINRSRIKAGWFSSVSDSLVLSNGSLEVAEKINIDSSSVVLVSNFKFYSNELIYIQAKLNVESVTFRSNKVIIESRGLNFEQVKAEAVSDLILNYHGSASDCVMKNSNFKSEQSILFSGALVMRACSVFSSSVYFNYNGGSISGSWIRAVDQLVLKNKNRSAMFEFLAKSKIFFGSLFLTGQVDVVDSKLMGFGAAHERVIVSGVLGLTHSDFHSDSSVTITKGGEISCHQRSTVSAASIAQFGPLHLEGGSLLLSGSVSQYSSQSSFDDSMSLTQHTHLSRSALEVKNHSYLAARSFISQDSKVYLDSSRFCAGQVLGDSRSRMNASKAALSVNQLHISGDFSLKSQSTLNAVSVFLSGRATLSSSAVFTKDFAHIKAMAGPNYKALADRRVVQYSESKCSDKLLVQDDRLSQYHDVTIQTSGQCYLGADARLMGQVQVSSSADIHLNGVFSSIEEEPDGSAESASSLILNAVDEVNITREGAIIGLGRSLNIEESNPSKFGAWARGAIESIKRALRRRDVVIRVSNSQKARKHAAILVSIQSKELLIYGKVRVSQFLAHGCGMDVAKGGTLKADSIEIKFDHFIYVEGVISADYINLVGNLFMYTGLIKARRMMQVQGVLCLPVFSRIAANNCINLSWFNINIGLIHPNFKGGFKDILTVGNVFSATLGVAQILLCAGFPVLSPAIHAVFFLASVVPMVLRKVPEIIRFIANIKNSGGKKKRPFEMYEILSKFSFLPGLFMSAGMLLVHHAHSKTTSTNIGFSLKDFARKISPAVLWDDLKQWAHHPFSNAGKNPVGFIDGFKNFMGDIQHSPFMMMCVQASRAFLPCDVNQGFLSLNLGLHCAPGLVDTSLFSWNGGIQGGLLLNSNKHLVDINTGGIISVVSFHQTFLIEDLGFEAAYSLNVTAEAGMNSGVLLSSEASFMVDYFNQNGVAVLGHGALNIASFKMGKHSITLLNGVSVSAVAVSINGQVVMIRSSIKAENVVDNSKMLIQGASVVNADNQTLITGGSSIDATHYTHTGTIQGGADSQLLVKAEHSDLHGSAHLADLRLELADRSGEEVADFMMGNGEGAHYVVDQRLNLVTDHDVQLVGENHRDVNLNLHANSVAIRTDLEIDHDINIDSNEGVKIAKGAAVSCKKLQVRSRDGVTNNGVLHAQERFVSDSVGRFDNRGTVDTHDAFIASSSMHNIHDAESEGKISASGVAIVSARDGDITNDGGEIAAGDVLQLGATGDINNNAFVTTEKGQFADITHHHAGRIAGGTGESNKGVGLVADAQGHVTGKSSEFTSVGKGYISGKKGVNFESDHCTYVSNIKKHGVGIRSKTVSTSTIIDHSSVSSENAETTIVSEEGAVRAVSTDFYSKKGTTIVAKGDVQLLSLVTHDKVVKTHKFLVLKFDNHNTITESAAPTLMNIAGQSNVVTQANADFSGAKFDGNGHLNLDIVGDLIFSRFILNHMSHQSGFSIGFSRPLQNLNNVDPSIAQMQALAGSESSTELAVNGLAAAVELNNDIEDLKEGGVLQTLRERTGLGDKDKFNPKLGFSIGWAKTDTKWQTLGPEGLNIGGRLTMKVGGKIILKNGVHIHAAEGIEVDTPVLEEHAAVLNSHVSHTGVSVSAKVGVFDGKIASASAGYQHQQFDSQQVVQSSLSSEGGVHIHNGDSGTAVTLNGGVVRAPKITGKMSTLTVTDRQDSTHQSSTSFGVGTSFGEHSSGLQLSGNHNRSSSETTNSVSGLYAQDASGLTVENATMQGGALMAEAGKGAHVERLTATAMTDRESSHGFGLSLNTSDCAKQKAGEPKGNHIPVVGVDISSSETVVERKPLVQAEVASGDGFVENEADIQHVVTDKHTNIKALVPFKKPNADSLDNHNAVQLPEPAETQTAHTAEEARVPDAEPSENHVTVPAHVTDRQQQDSVSIPDAHDKAVDAADEDDMSAQELQAVADDAEWGRCAQENAADDGVDSESQPNPLLQTGLFLGKEVYTRHITGLGPAPTRFAKMYVGGKAVFVAYLMNAALRASSQTDGNGSVLKDAAVDTASDWAASKVLSKVLPRILSAPVGAVITVVQGADYYAVYEIPKTQKEVDRYKRLLEESVANHSNKAVAYAWFQMEQSNKLMGLKGIHYLAHAVSYPFDKLVSRGKWLFDKVINDPVDHAMHQREEAAQRGLDAGHASQKQRYPESAWVFRTVYGASNESTHAHSVDSDKSRDTHSESSTLPNLSQHTMFANHAHPARPAASDSKQVDQQATQALAVAPSSAHGGRSSMLPPQVNQPHSRRVKHRVKKYVVPAANTQSLDAQSEYHADDAAHGDTLRKSVLAKAASIAHQLSQVRLSNANLAHADSHVLASAQSHCAAFAEQNNSACPDFSDQERSYMGKKSALATGFGRNSSSDVNAGFGREYSVDSGHYYFGHVILKIWEVFVKEKDYQIFAFSPENEFEPRDTLFGSADFNSNSGRSLQRSISLVIDHSKNKLVCFLSGAIEHSGTGPRIIQAVEPRNRFVEILKDVSCYSVIGSSNGFPECRKFKVLFPFQANGNHWNLGELTLTMNDEGAFVMVELVLIEPFYQKSPEDYPELMETLKTAFKEQPARPTLEIRHTKQQHNERGIARGGTSCGAICAENGIFRIIDAPVLNETFPAGAKDLREKHLNMVGSDFQVGIPRARSNACVR